MDVGSLVRACLKSGQSGGTGSERDVARVDASAETQGSLLCERTDFPASIRFSREGKLKTASKRLWAKITNQMAYRKRARLQTQGACCKLRAKRRPEAQHDRNQQFTWVIVSKPNDWANAFAEVLADKLFQL